MSEQPVSTAARILKGPTLWVAIAALVAWFGFSLFLLIEADNSSEQTWTRMAWVFGSIQAVGFAAAGALFGTAVQREQTAKAEERADSAESDARANSELAAKGQAFGAVAQAEALTAGEDADRLTPMGPGQPSTEQDETRRRHADISRALFGDLLPPR
jgi:hypothetical protein